MWYHRHVLLLRYAFNGLVEQRLLLIKVTAGVHRCVNAGLWLNITVQFLATFAVAVLTNLALSRLGESRSVQVHAPYGIRRRWI